MPELVMVGFVYRMGSWAHEAHISPQHIPQLREFVEARPAEESSDPCHPRVVLPRRGVIVLGQHRVHGSEFPQPECLPVQADPLLVEERRPGEIRQGIIAAHRGGADGALIFRYPGPTPEMMREIRKTNEEIAEISG